MTAMLAPPRSKPETPKERVAPSEPGCEDRFVFTDVDWQFYDHVLDAANKRRIFVTYYKGMLEVMSPSYEHDGSGELLAALVRIVATELKVPHKGAGSTTLRRRRVQAGLEPDRCFYIRNVSAIRGKRQIDLNIDPPPDLAIEVEMSRRLGERVNVYEALRVPELWRYDGQSLRVFELGEARTYVERDRSIAFPDLPLEQVHRFVQLGWDMDELEWDRTVRTWIRRNLRKAKGRRRRK
jgi:Uma2 family endonuclease